MTLLASKSCSILVEFFDYLSKFHNSLFLIKIKSLILTFLQKISYLDYSSSKAIYVFSSILDSIIPLILLILTIFIVISLIHLVIMFLNSCGLSLYSNREIKIEIRENTINKNKPNFTYTFNKINNSHILTYEIHFPQQYEKEEKIKLSRFEISTSNRILIKYEVYNIINIFMEKYKELYLVMKKQSYFVYNYCVEIIMVIVLLFIYKDTYKNSNISQYLNLSNSFNLYQCLSSSNFKYFSILIHFLIYFIIFILILRILLRFIQLKKLIEDVVIYYKLIKDDILNIELKESLNKLISDEKKLYSLIKIIFSQAT
ncbi:hypothetical protein [Deferribacter abyssi]|uniref:hypothetical protein n=1 Tax=Deferribacter abyssi TaxID=213806 RepID=UPI003C1547D4